MPMDTAMDTDITDTTAMDTDLTTGIMDTVRQCHNKGFRFNLLFIQVICETFWGFKAFHGRSSWFDFAVEER